MQKNKIVSSLVSEAADEIIRLNINRDEEALGMIEAIAFTKYKGDDIDELSWAIDRAFGKLRGQLGPLSYLMKDDDVSEIMINGTQEIYVERGGEINKLDDSFDSKEELEQIIRRIAASVRREVNEMSPILDARLKDGSRVNAVLSNIALDGPVLTVRKFRQKKISVEEMIEEGELTEEAASTLKVLVEAGYNIFVSGGTSSGKTTFLNALSDFVPKHERVITIEDSAELQVKGIPNLVRMECRNSNSTGQGDIQMDALIKASLRMRPDRIIVGEVRGREVSDMLQALNTGHSGMSTGHGNSIKGMLRRLEAMYISGHDMPIAAVRSQIVEAIDVMVHLAKLGDGRRKVLEISEIIGFRDNDYEIEPVYLLDDDLNLVKTKNTMRKDMRLKVKGISYV